MKLKNIKKTALIGGSIIILLYLILGLIESTSKISTFFILVPLLVWPYIVWRYEPEASIFSIAIGCITILWFVIDFLILRAEMVFWHVPVFVLIAPLPAFLIGWMLWNYSEKRHITFKLYPDLVKEFKKLEKRFLKKKT